MNTYEVITNRIIEKLEQGVVPWQKPWGEKAGGFPKNLITKKDLYQTNRMLDLLKSSSINLIVLAGFLWMIPEKILNAFPKKIINIHPALLPKHGGAGMYGLRVHQAVMAAKEKETGITIHYLNERFDEGEIIFISR